MWKPVLAGAGTLFLLAGTAAAQVSATATTDLNIRSGPGPEFPVIGVIDASAGVPISGCIEGGSWCQVTYNGIQGWAYADYLVASYGGNQVVLAQPPPELGVPTVTYEGSPSAALPGAVGGAVVGAIVGGPVGAAIGGTAGAVAGAAVDPPQQVRTYVTSNPVDPVYLQGEVVVGAALPETVEVVPIPEYQYSYVYVNGVPVLVEPQSHRIVHVFR